MGTVSLNYAPQTVTAEEYQRIFELERSQVYPMVDAYEARKGFALERNRLEEAARVLSCPFKAAPPNWQHGRVLYATVRHYLDTFPVHSVKALDIGTAKGFSALCVLWAITDHGRYAHVTSVDVLPPEARVRRNTVSEVDNLKTLYEIHHPWPELRGVNFVESTGIDWLKQHKDRVHVAFVDGKHDGTVVLKEGKLLADRQVSGDVAMFDDVQIPGLLKATQQLDFYDFEYMDVLPTRKYAIGVRK